MSDIQMSLLYSQSLEIEKLYFQNIQKDTIIKLKYYLVPKKWLDGYKYRNNYASIVQNINKSDCLDYNNFKSKVNNSIQNYNLQNELNEIESLNEKGIIPKYQINFPKDFIPVKEEIFIGLKNNFLYEIVIGERNIFIFDNSSDRNIFICSLDLEQDNKDITEFVVNVDSILILNEKKVTKEIKKLFNYISENKGINNYYKERNIDYGKLGEQIVYDKELEEIGIFYKIKNRTEYITIEKKFNEYINKTMQNEEINNNDLKGSTVVGLKPYLKEVENRRNSSIINNKNENKPKCVTICGDIYYYTKKHEHKDNCYITEYKNNNKNYN